MSWFTKLLPSIRSRNSKKDIPEGLWRKCNECQAILYNSDLERNLLVCTQCNYHFPFKARKRLETFLDVGSTKEITISTLSVDKLKFRDSKKYKDRLIDAQKATCEQDALVSFQGNLFGLPIVACAFDFDFIGGSMGAAVGEKFVQSINKASQTHSPLICFTASGGARMQEGLISLFQMSKTSAALVKLAESGIPYITVLTNPTMGGVSASLAMLGDIIIAEPNALIGFSGPRVIEQTIRRSLPEGFQRSEFLLEHGAIDKVIDRRELRIKIAQLLAKLCRQSANQSIPAF